MAYPLLSTAPALPRVRDASTVTLFDAPEELPLWPESAALAMGRTVVLAPHPDDESLGCGGLLALLARHHVPARVLFMTDGTRSHPNSPSYPAPRLAALRESEACQALSALGFETAPASFLRYPDCELPEAGTLTFERVAVALAERLDSFGTETLLVPWRRDPHCDHEATWLLARQVVKWMAPKPLWLEYAIWGRVRGGDAAPKPSEADAWRLDITSVLDRKRTAIAAHRSQTTRMIDDDPEGFCLSHEDLAHFDDPWEVFIAPHDAQ